GDADTFGRNLAVLLGDLAHTRADALMDRLPRRFRDAWYELCIELIVGQRADLTSAAAGRRDLFHAKEVGRLKSGAYTVSRPLQLGALAAGASERAMTALLRAGRDIGQAFAYRDDILGVWGDVAVTGKPAGDDLAEGKATVILALAHEHLLGEDGDRLHRLGTEAMQDDDVAVLQRALLAAGIRDEVEELINRRMASAFRHLDSEHLEERGVAGLREAARVTAWRDL
ncbi:MAG: isopentenyl-diphosphate Delta-isomerase, partial [Propionibacterium sp.]|nr:isopentenyl-diphosphate Delta-isomerase [Propionibacterium sp.]